MRKQASKPFELIAGNAALDLVNTLDFRFRKSGPEEFLNTYDDLLRFVSESRLIDARELARLKRSTANGAKRQHLLGEVRHFREALSAVTYAIAEGGRVPRASLAAVEKCLQEASAARRLVIVNGRPVWKWRETAGHSLPLWLLAEQAADLLMSHQVLLLRTCASETCRSLFLDTSKSHTRRWCDMKLCGNRMKARRFYAKQMEA